MQCVTVIYLPQVLQFVIATCELLEKGQWVVTAGPISPSINPSDQDTSSIRGGGVLATDWGL